MIADKHGDAGVFEAVDCAIHELDYGEAASPCQTKMLLAAAPDVSKQFDSGTFGNMNSEFEPGPFSLLHVAATMFDEDFARRCLPFDSDAAKHYANIVSERTRQGCPISVEDAQIASIARANGLSIATRNVKDFSNIEGLVVLNPWQVTLG